MYVALAVSGDCLTFSRFDFLYNAVAFFLDSLTYRITMYVPGCIRCQRCTEYAPRKSHGYTNRNALAICDDSPMLEQ